MNNIYEISVWDDVYDQETDSYKEKKLLVIGSNIMTSQARARNPNLVTKMDGTVTLNFDLYYRYIDLQTGEEIKNPYVPYLVNERKVKALWKGEWYDLLVKSINEDSTGKVFSYSCESAYITELSRTGFSLEFQSELANNIGTAPQLVQEVIKDTDWQFKPGDLIYQTTMESVFEVESTAGSMEDAIKEPEGETQFISAHSPILVFYSNFSDENNMPSTLFFHYANGEGWQRDGTSMEVLNGSNYRLDGVTWTHEGRVFSVYKNGSLLLTVDLSEGLSTQYVVERYVDSQKTAYSKVLGRYVNVYEDEDHDEVYGYQTTDFTSPLTVANLVANPNNFTNVLGWYGEGLIFKVLPEFNSSTVLENYDPVSYLRVVRDGNTNQYIWNNGVTRNAQFVENGFIKGETYIFRIKVKNGSNYIRNTGSFTPFVSTQNAINDPYFSGVALGPTSDNYLEYQMTCQKSCSVEQLRTSLFNELYIGIEIKNNGTYYFEDVQFYKEVYGENDGDTQRINPGEMETQGVAETNWKFFYARKDDALSEEELEYDYIGENEWSAVTPVYNAFEKITTIEASQSNRFNILQDIAEKFQCWVRFIIEHEDDGSIKLDENDKPCKYVILLRENGKHTGVNFVYGVDLQGIKRNLKSSSISTKTIVLQNNNEFGQNGFCTIARSLWNYTKENVIYNFDYYIDQGLLNQEQLNGDLYSAPNGYFYILHEKNTEYDSLTEEYTKKNTEYTRQFAQKELYGQYLSAAEQQKVQVENNLMRLAGVESMDDIDNYLQEHGNNTKVKTLLSSRAQIIADIAKYQATYDAFENSLIILEEAIDNLINMQQAALTTIEQAHAAFYRKYSRFIQEGVWNSEDYWDDNKYYFDAASVAYESSRPQIEYDISIVRLSDLDEYSSKVFDLGDICTIQDIKYFGYKADGITPYKEEVFISEITSFFDTPDKDTFKVQNYKSNFDDLFQRITATTQSLEFSEGKYAKAANAINSNGTIKYSVLQDTFDQNRELVMGSLNESVLIDNRGITVSAEEGGASQVRITSGGIFVTNDGGETWKNAVRGDGISADVLTAGQINTEQISIYGSDAPSFIWDDKGISAYLINANGTDPNKYVRFDKYGIYGMQDTDNQEFIPQSEDDIYNNASFGLTWNKFFLKNKTSYGGVEISSDSDILVTAGSGNSEVERVKIGNLGNNNYGIRIKDAKGNSVFVANNNGVSISGSVTIGSYTADQISDKVDDTIISEIIYYLASSNNSGITTSSAGWTTDVTSQNATLTPINKYLWTYKVQTHGDGTTNSTTPIITGVYGNEGHDGQPGENAINVVIESSAGNIFRNNDVVSTLTCTVYSGTVDITNQVTSFTWKKKNSDGTIDTSWSRLLAGRTITIGPDDIYSKAIFICEVEF